jgi:hypothetical protein
MQTRSTNYDLVIAITVFRLGPVQGSDSGFWPGHRVVRVNYFYFFKIKTTLF